MPSIPEHLDNFSTNELLNEENSNEPCTSEREIENETSLASEYTVADEDPHFHSLSGKFLKANKLTEFLSTETDCFEKIPLSSKKKFLLDNSENITRKLKGVKH